MRNTGIGLPHSRCIKCGQSVKPTTKYDPPIGTDPRLRKFVCPRCGFVFFKLISPLPSNLGKQARLRLDGPPGGAGVARQHSPEGLRHP